MTHENAPVGENVFFGKSVENDDLDGASIHVRSMVEPPLALGSRTVLLQECEGESSLKLH